MKKLLIGLMTVISCALIAEGASDAPEQKVDQFQLMNGCYMKAYMKAMEHCKDNGYMYFLFKSFSYRDDYGQSVEMQGVKEGLGGDLIAGSCSDEFRTYGGNIRANYEIYCYREMPKNHLASDVEGFYRMVNLYQNQPTEKVEGSNVIEINSMEELKKELSSTKTPVFVECYSNSCPPCKMLSPRYDQYSKDLSSNGKFLKINLEKVTELAEAYAIKGIPTLLIFQEEKLQEKKVGLPDIAGHFEALKTSPR
ncbi:MAG: Thioredoxin C-1 [Chlamydiae bacterium]|nr:Thioredoxin C-1 [Chlamydiota bacterium]